MSDDLNLLKLAAKAAGMDYLSWGGANAVCMALVPHEHRIGGRQAWNPLRNDGDALRLAVKLRIRQEFERYNGIEYACATPPGTHQGFDEVIEVDSTDPHAAMRRSIVRAAAEIGRALP